MSQLNRKCCSCKRIKNISLFPKNKTEKGGYAYQCKKCKNKHCSQVSKTEEYKEKRRLWYNHTKIKRREYFREYYAKHKGRIYENAKKSRLKRLEKIRIYRRAIQKTDKYKVYKREYQKNHKYKLWRKQYRNSPNQKIKVLEREFRMKKLLTDSFCKRSLRSTCKTIKASEMPPILIMIERYKQQMKQAYNL